MSAIGQPEVVHAAEEAPTPVEEALSTVAVVVLSVLLLRIVINAARKGKS